MTEYRYYPGATAVGIIVKDGVVLAADKRVTYGFMLMSRAGKKVYKITDRIGIASAGLISDMQTLARSLEAEAKLYEYDTGAPITVRGMAKLLSLILFNRRLFPYFVETIVGGVDLSGPHIFVLDPIGALIEDKYAALGTGAQLAISIIEDEYDENASLEDARRLAVKSVKAAFSRDAISGDGIDLILIGKDFTKEEFIPVV
ncbi:MAG: proteasome endopeptidase complex, archaeal, beta subunit [Thermoprotei archaeon]|nr:MAG: proteasome endopeptidase complex, archaeal, beta subunit [Thermoprotei archaeon]